MKVLKAKIRKSSVHYRKGLGGTGKSVWLKITGFNTHGEHNYRIRAIKGFKQGFAEYEEIWMKGSDLLFRQFEDNQLSLDIYSKEEMKENKNNPRYFNQRRFEVITINKKFYIHAPDLETAKKVVKGYGIADFRVKQVARLRKKELE
jgi:hypothetical protein